MTRKTTHERADLARKVLALNLPGFADDTYADRIGSGLPIIGEVQKELDRNGITVESLRQAGFVRSGTNQLDFVSLDRAVREQLRGSSSRGPSF